MGTARRRCIWKTRKPSSRCRGDRQGTFEPAILPKHRKRVPLFNDQIISMYSFGMTNRDIKSHLEQVYHVRERRDLFLSPVGCC
ncbi:MAG: transposase [Treponema sp.]|nr:transposase [Treponema sp.]